MKNKKLIVLILTFFSLKLIGQVIPPSNRFVKYLYQNRSSIRMDNEIIKDKDFIINIPYAQKSVITHVGNMFTHILEFENRKAVVIIYSPLFIYNENVKEYNCDYKLFKNYLHKYNIDSIKNKFRLRRIKRFGIKIDKDKCFIVAYVNISKKEVDLFNYTLDSFNFPAR
jgi:hypothetical protein